uniref:Uncharacterized protein n=1 Tax=Onchocerca volvulus TaxID=6282 RepID=A0A8R1TXE8_ONCVO
MPMIRRTWHDASNTDSGKYQLVLNLVEMSQLYRKAILYRLKERNDVSTCGGSYSGTIHTSNQSINPLDEKWIRVIGNEFDKYFGGYIQQTVNSANRSYKPKLSKMVIQPNKNELKESKAKHVCYFIEHKLHCIMLR